MNGPGGDLPLLLWHDGAPRRAVRAGAGAGRGARWRRYRALGLELVPGTGYLAACVPGAFDAWLLLLRDYGTWELADVLAYAIGYARDGFPSTPGIARAIAALRAGVDDVAWRCGRRWARGCATRCWPTPTRGSRARGGASREARIDAARDAWYRGWVAEAIVDAVAEPALDSSGEPTRACSRATISPRSRRRRGAGRAGASASWTVFKTGPWGQGPVFLQQLALLEGVELGPFLGVEHVHTVIEGAKLAFADREALLRRLGAGAARAAALARVRGRAAGADRRRRRRWSCGPGSAGGCRRCGRARRRRRAWASRRAATPAISTSPTASGNLVSATPSGGWLQSSPAMPGLGFCLGTRAQMFWLEDGLPASLVRRPAAAHDAVAVAGAARRRHGAGLRHARRRPAGPVVARVLPRPRRVRAGPAGGDRRADVPHDRTSRARSTRARPSRGGWRSRAACRPRPMAALRARGHDVAVADDWSLGRLSAISRSPDGLLRGAANPRGMQGYARRSLSVNAPASGITSNLRRRARGR